MLPAVSRMGCFTLETYIRRELPRIDGPCCFRAQCSQSMFYGVFYPLGNGIVGCVRIYPAIPSQGFVGRDNPNMDGRKRNVLNQRMRAAWKKKLNR